VVRVLVIDDVRFRRDQLVAALRRESIAAEGGEVTCPPAIAAALLRGMGGRGAKQRAQADRLTPREREVLLLVEAGLTNKEIARKLSIEIRTVKNHVHNLMEKLDVRRGPFILARDFLIVVDAPVKGNRSVIHSRIARLIALRRAAKHFLTGGETALSFRLRPSLNEVRCTTVDEFAEVIRGEENGEEDSCPS
jgi:DNA-binding NarL/FixJ family response regulator